MNTKREHIGKLTSLLRAAEDPLWARLRVLLRKKGLDPGQLLLAECFPDDAQFEFGMVVTEDGKVFQFGFDYLHKTVDQGSFTEWVDLTGRFRGTPHRESITLALEMSSDSCRGANPTGG